MNTKLPLYGMCLLLGLLSLQGCSTKQAYESIKQNQCREQTGNMYCDDVQSYEDYQRDREELLK